MRPLRRHPGNGAAAREPASLLTGRTLTLLRKALGGRGWGLFAAALVPTLLFVYAQPVIARLERWFPTIPREWYYYPAQTISFGAFMLVPFVAAAMAWWQTRFLVREEALVQLLVTPVPRRTLLLTALRHSMLFRSAVPLLLIPFFVYVIWELKRMYSMVIANPRPENVLQYFCNGPICVAMMLSPDTWYHPSEGFRWWFADCPGNFPDPFEGAWLLAAANLTWLHAAMRLGVSSAAYCGVAGRGSFGALVRAFLWIAAAVGTGLLLVHLLQKYAIVPNYKPGMPYLDAPDWPPLNWFGRLVGFRQYTYLTVLAVMNGLAALPVAAAALFSKSLLRAAGRRLDRLNED